MTLEMNGFSLSGGKLVLDEVLEERNPPDWYESAWTFPLTYFRAGVGPWRVFLWVCKGVSAMCLE